MVVNFIKNIFDIICKNLYRALSTNRNHHSNSIIYLVDVGSDLRATNLPYIEIFGDEEFYKALGYNENRYESDWFKENGISSNDKNGDGIIKEFPVFSKSYWMHVNASKVNFDEMDELIKECDRAIKLNLIQEQTQTFEKIKEMALFAKSNNLEIVFGHH